MKGIESLLASMIGMDANKMQEMMTGFIDNAAYLARGIDEIKASINNINERLAAMEDKIPPVSLPVLELEERADNVQSSN